MDDQNNRLSVCNCMVTSKRTPMHPHVHVVYKVKYLDIDYMSHTHTHTHTLIHVHVHVHAYQKEGWLCLLLILSPFQCSYYLWKGRHAAGVVTQLPDTNGLVHCSSYATVGLLHVCTCPDKCKMRRACMATVVTTMTKMIRRSTVGNLHFFFHAQRKKLPNLGSNSWFPFQAHTI